MTSVVVSLGLGWNSTTTGWGDGGWGNDVAIATGATAALGTAVFQGDANVALTGFGLTGTLGIVFETQNGLTATSALGNTFETQNGFLATSALGNTFETQNGLAATSALGNVFETQNGFAATSALGSFFTTNTTVSMTGAIGSSTVTGDANITLTGLGVVGSVSSRGVLIWGEIIPAPGTAYTTIVPSPGTTYTEIVVR